MSMNKRRALLWTLVASLALNLFFVGAIGARMLDHRDRSSTPPSLGWILRDLEPQLQASLRPQLQQYGESLRPVRGQMFRAQREVNRLLAQDALDKEAILVAFEELRQINLRYQQLSHEGTLAVVSQLAPEQRSRVFRFMSGRRNPVEASGFRRSGGDPSGDEAASQGSPD
ncbi:periplasmic heavy metal sensor [Pseudohongiella sp.]|uniref:Zinc resistance-associated protein n=1 Tax=marine sediment metagenome TaxID=412755 RepID=A0A0F9VN37_9ZZZZ|nr:periplasmic heavy metal sensor [Pseudohongiella sp.]HDZ10344.1 periplasmic heavy metal sensor [Pseudohongiella sp.]HEA62033.1 periplasmic heavy metal sensor [Pseudohongiella sp.]